MEVAVEPDALARTVGQFRKIFEDAERAIGELKKLAEYAASMPNTQYYIRNIWNIEIELVVGDYQEYCRIIDDLRARFSGMIKTLDSVYMRTDEWTPGLKNMFEAHGEGKEKDFQ